MLLLNVCGFHIVTGMHELIPKALITILDVKFDMLHLVHEMVRQIFIGEHPNNSRKYTRFQQRKGVTRRSLYHFVNITHVEVEKI